MMFTQTYTIPPGSPTDQEFVDQCVAQAKAQAAIDAVKSMEPGKIYFIIVSQSIGMRRVPVGPSLWRDLREVVVQIDLAR